MTFYILYVYLYYNDDDNNLSPENRFVDDLDIDEFIINNMYFYIN